MSTDIENPEAAYQEDLPTGGFGLLLLKVTRFFAACGGLILLGVVLVTTTSVAGRYLLSMPVPGDYEITEFGCGVAILLFFPFCEMTYGNIKAEFFTDSLAEWWKQVLNIVAEIAFLGVSALLAWRFVIGGLKRLGDGQTSMELNIPLWWGYVPGTFAMALLVVVCAWRIVDSLDRAGKGKAQ